MSDNRFERAFAELRERNAHLTTNAPADAELFWRAARHFFLAGARTFGGELVTDEALRGPLALLMALADVQDDLNRATDAMLAEIGMTRH